MDETTDLAAAMYSVGEVARLAGVTVRARMYVADPRFAAHYDATAPGLAALVRDAIVGLYPSSTS